MLCASGFVLVCDNVFKAVLFDRVHFPWSCICLAVELPTSKGPLCPQAALFKKDNGHCYARENHTSVLCRIFVEFSGSSLRPDGQCVGRWLEKVWSIIKRGIRQHRLGAVEQLNPLKIGK